MNDCGYIPVRVKGSILFEYNPMKKLIRIKRSKKMHLIDLEAVEAGVSMQDISAAMITMTRQGKPKSREKS